MIKNLNRRDFTKLSMAALGGVVAGSMLGGCETTKSGGGGGSTDLTSAKHVCRGLNTCKAKGACKTASNDCKGKNACAGQGKCASAKAHGCHTMNDCKGQGGCGDNPGENACKGKGKCAVPLKAEAWAKARPAFEAAMKKAGKKVGKAPAAPAA